MKTQLIFKISKTEVIVEAQAGEHEPNEIGRLVNFRYPGIMLDCIKVFYQHHRDWLLDGEEKDDLKTEDFVVAKDKTKPTNLSKEKTQEASKAFFSPVISSPKQRIKFKDWEAIGTTTMGRIYREVIDHILREYKEGVEPSFKTISNIIREMYGEHLKESSIASYTSIYKRYIKENKLAIEPTAKEVKTNNLHIGEPIVKTTQKKA